MLSAGKLERAEERALALRENHPDSATAHRLVAEGGYMLVQDAPPVTQPVYQAVHLRHRHSPTHRKLLTILRRRFSATDQG